MATSMPVLICGVVAVAPALKICGNAPSHVCCMVGTLVEYEIHGPKNVSAVPS